VPIFFKYGSLNLLEPLGPVQACNEIAFTVSHKKGYLIYTAAKYLKLMKTSFLGQYYTLINYIRFISSQHFMYGSQ
jgi:hypothetical protein